jgi:5-methylcytosine-specific restriction endonuclease McrA
MNELPFIDDPVQFKLELRRLIELRESGKQPRRRGSSLSREQRKVVHEKTDGRCHVCGDLVDLANFEADHVKNHTSGGISASENYLPACSTCNGYRWHYGPEELQWILKLGIWAKTQIDKETAVGTAIAEGFVSHEKRREGRRTQPRSPQTYAAPNKAAHSDT